MQDWTSDALWQKAKLYCSRAFAEERESELFPLFASLALEFLGKAALAKVHPALIADPQDGKNILFAFNYPSTDKPQTIPAKTVYSRLRLVVEAFTEDDEVACMLMADLRNRELHTAALAYKNFPNGKWLPEFYRVASTLSDFIGRKLDDLLGKQEAKAARDAIHTVEEKTKKAVKERIGKCKQKIASLRATELEQRRKENEPKGRLSAAKGGAVIITKKCPACESKGLLHSKRIGVSPPRLVDGALRSEHIFSPQKYECKICDLELSGIAELRIGELADQISLKERIDPVDFFNIDVSDFDEPDYGNE